MTMGQGTISPKANKGAKIMQSRFALTLAFLLLLSPTVAAQAADPDPCVSWALETGHPEMESRDTDYQMICHEGYLVAYNLTHKTPDWVLEVLTPERLVKNAKRKGLRFKPDPAVKRSESAVSSDYTHSGFDRGHMSPAGDNTWKMQAMKESFYLSNVAPQYGPSMNRGIWKKLETRTRDWTKARGRIIVVSGPFYGAKPKSIKNGVAVPDGFFKVLYDPGIGRALGFYFENKPYKGAKLADFITPIAEIEEKTGITFFPAMDRRTQTRLVSSKGGMWR